MDQRNVGDRVCYDITETKKNTLGLIVSDIWTFLLFFKKYVNMQGFFIVGYIFINRALAFQIEMSFAHY